MDKVKRAVEERIMSRIDRWLVVLVLVLVLLQVLSSTLASAETRECAEVVEIIFVDQGWGSVEPGEPARVIIRLVYRGEEISASQVLRIDISGPNWNQSIEKTYYKLLRQDSLATLEVYLEVPRDAIAYLPYTANITIMFLGEQRKYLCSISTPTELVVEPLAKWLEIEASIKPINYPGTSRARIEIIVENKGSYVVESVNITVEPPSGWEPRSYSFEIRDLEPGEEHVEVIQDVYIPKWVEPGRHSLLAEVELQANTTSFTTKKSWKQVIYVEVKEPPPYRLGIVEAGWAIRPPPPGAIDYPLVVVLENQEQATIVGYRAVLRLPPGLSIDGRDEVVVAVEDAAIGYTDLLEITIGIDVDQETKPGLYQVELHLELVVSREGVMTIQYYEGVVEIEIVPKASPGISVEYAGWTGSAAYPGEIGADYRIVFVNRGEYILEAIVLEVVEAPPWLNLSTTRVVLDQVALGYGEAVEATLEATIGEWAEPGNYSMLVHIRYILVGEQGHRLEALVEEELPVAILEKPKPRLEVVDAEWASWVVGTEGAVASIRIKLLYLGEHTVIYAIARARPARDLELRGGLEEVVVEQRVSLTPGQPLELTIPGLQVPPGATSPALNIELELVHQSPNQGVYRTRQALFVELSSPLEEPLEVSLVQTEPPRLLPGSRDTIVVATIVNRAPDPVRLVGVSIVDSGGLVVLGASGECLEVALPPGSSCSLELRIDVPPGVEPGITNITALIAYSVGAEETTSISQQSLEIKVRIWSVEELAPRLEILSVQWISQLGERVSRAYWGSEEATLEVVVYNPGRDSVSSVRVSIEPLSPGVAVTKQPDPCNVIDAGGSCRAIAYLSLREGSSRDKVLLRIQVYYVYTVYNTYVELSVSSDASLLVASPSDAVEVLGLLWLTQPTPGSSASKLLVVVEKRHEEIISMPYVVLELPEGLLDPQDGDRLVVALPQQEELLAPSEPLGALVERLLATTGEVGLYVASIGIEEGVEPGVYNVTVRVVLRDQHGSRLYAEEKYSLPLHGYVGFVEVKVPEYVDLRAGRATLEVNLTNTGVAPARNIYVSLVSQTPSAFPVVSTKHLDELSPGVTKSVEYTLVYNPAGLAGSETYTFSGLLVLVYEDPLGGLHVYNSTIATILLPETRLEIVEASAVWVNGTLEVEGVLQNKGVEDAYSVEVSLPDIGESLLLGTLEAAVESPFKLSARLNKAPEWVELVVEYRDFYGRLYKVLEKISVRVVEVNITETPRVEGGVVEAVRGWAILIIALSVTTGVALFIVVMKKRSRRELEGAWK